MKHDMNIYKIYKTIAHFYIQGLDHMPRNILNIHLTLMISKTKKNFLQQHTLQETVLRGFVKVMKSL